MIGRLKEFLAGNGAAPDDHQVRLAAAALLVEAATLDGSLAAAERARIEALLAERFGLSAAEAAELFAQGMKAAAESVQLVAFTRAIKDRFDLSQRVRMIEMLWEVAYADGHLHDYEANLVRRVAGLIFVPDREAGAARKRAMARLGLDEGLA